MNLNSLRYFKVLAELEHYGKAADRLHITQPSLSHNIAKLEEELHALLFERVGRNIRLTEQGQIFYQRIRFAMAEIEQAESELIQNTITQNNTISLTCSLSYANYELSPFLARFLEKPQNKDVYFMIYQRHTASAEDQLLNREVDLGIVPSMKDKPEINYTPIFFHPLSLIVSLDHPLAEKDEVYLKDTAPYDYIFHLPTTGLYSTLANAFLSEGIIPRKVLEVESEYVSVSLVEANVGISIVPYSKMIDQFQVKKIPLLDGPLGYYLYLAYVEGQKLSPAVERFKNFILSNTHF